MAKKKIETAELPGHYRYVGRGTRIIGIPARDLTPVESALYGEIIASLRERLYEWVPGAAVVIAQAPEPEYTTTTTALEPEPTPWAPGGTEEKTDV